MSSLVNYLSQPLKKLFSTPDFKAALRRYGLLKPSPVSYPFMWYPEAGLTVAGPKFRYVDGVQLISYHVKGIYQISSNYNGFDAYLCTISFPNEVPFLMPGSITGMFQSGGNGDIITTPLADGGLVEVNGVHLPISNFTATLSVYEDNPDPDGNYNYALIFTANVDNPDNQNVTGLMAYDFEFLLPADAPKPIVFQD